MDVRVSTYSQSELEAFEVHLRIASSFARSLGRHHLAVMLNQVLSEIHQHTLRLEADRRQYVARQLSLVPPGAYDEPSGHSLKAP